MTLFVNLLVEGDLDEAVARRLIEEVGAVPSVTYGKQGSGYIRSKIRGFGSSAVQQPLLALVDFLDTGEVCAPEVVFKWLPQRNPNVLFRVVVGEIESWLLADRANMATFLGVPLHRLPQRPERLRNPKASLIGLARRARRRAIREGLVPQQGAATGPLYNGLLARFVRETWDPDAAAHSARSLRACTRALRELVQRLR